MSAEKVRGIAEANALFDQLPADAQEQLGVELAIIGREILVDQQRLVPKDTGHLEGGLSLQLLLDKLKVRVGLINVRRGRDSRYYGRFVALGRAAQTVVVERRKRVDGRLRGTHRRKNLKDVVARYTLKVKAREARDFIRVPGAEQTAAGQLAEFWSRLLARQGISS